MRSAAQVYIYIYIQGLVTVLCGFCFASRTGFGTARSECESEIVWLGVWARAIQRPTLVGSCQGRISASSAAAGGRFSGARAAFFFILPRPHFIYLHLYLRLPQKPSPLHKPNPFQITLTHTVDVCYSQDIVKKNYT